MVASAGSRLQASQKFLAKSVHLQTITEAFFRAFRQGEADFDLSHHSGRSQGSTAGEQGVPQIRLSRSRHSLQAASEDQNLQAERSANVLCRHRRALSFLRGERSSNSSSELSTQQILVPVSPLTQISSRRSSHRPAVSETRWPRKKPKNKQKRRTS